MRKASVTIFLFLISLVSMASVIDLGYADKQTGAATGLMSSGRSSSSAAIRLDSKSLTRYAGNQVKAVRISLPNTRVYVDSIVVWVRSTIDGDNLATGKITRFKDDGYQNIATGWNSVELTSPCDIPSTGDLYVGYTYYQRTKVCATSAWYKGQQGFSFVKIGNDADWEPYSDGALCIEASVDGPSMPQYDMLLKSIRGTVSAEGSLTAEARVFNRGQQTATALTFDVSTDGGTQTFVVPANIAPNALDTLQFSLDGMPAGFGPGTNADFTLADINGYADEYGDDNLASCVFNYQRYLLLEEFTTEQCPNCPPMAERISNYINGGKEYSRQVLVVCHHSGYGTDGFTRPSDIDYEWFYNNGGDTYAPAVMFNRKPYTETKVGLSPVVFPQTDESMAGYIDDCLDGESSLILSSKAQLSSDGSKVTFTVNGRKMNGFNEANPRLFVYLTEDNVLSVNGQAGSGSDTYYHNHVVRGQNATWGDAIDWQDNDFTATYTFDIDPSWKTSDMKIIASVGNYDSENAGNCVIENSTVSTFGGTTGINGVRPSSSENVTYSYYSVNGCKLQHPLDRGVTIVKGSDGSVKKVYASAITSR